MLGQRHLIECHCVLPQYENKDPVVYHKFTVYSKFNERNKIIPKYANCNNCGITHKVFDICQSEIFYGKEDVFVITKEDVKRSLPKNISDILDEHECDITQYELLEDVIYQNLYPFDIILNREIIEDEHHIKVLEVNENKTRIYVDVIRTLMR